MWKAPFHGLGTERCKRDEGQLSGSSKQTAWVPLFRSGLLSVLV